MGNEVFKYAISKEVSIAGIRVICEGELANTLFGRYILVTPGANVTVNMEMKVPDKKANVSTVECRGKVISVNRTSQSRFLVGIEFLEFDEECEIIWGNYISKLR